MKIGNRVLGGEAPAYIIAEACDNHLGSMQRAREMVLAAKKSGCDAVKFQHHLAAEEMLRDVPMSANFSEPLFDFLEKYALTIDQHAELKMLCESIGIDYLCTPFSYVAARELFEIGVTVFKIGSGEMADIPSLERMAEKFSLPMIISTGMSTLKEIDRTYNALSKYDISLGLLNCVSEYPPLYEDINLGVIPIMRERYPGAVIGHSDHTPDIYTVFGAVALGAKIIEKHVILDKTQAGPDQSVSINFVEMRDLVDGVRKIELALGDEKCVHEREKSIRSWAYRSLVTLRHMEAGEIIRASDIWSKRPGTGIPAAERNRIIGKTLRVSVSENQLLQWSDFE